MRRAALPPAVTITSAPGVDPVHYSVSQSSTAWAAFDLSTNLDEDRRRQ